MVIRLIPVIVYLVLCWPAHAAEAKAIRLGLLKFGTVSWEMDTIKAHRLDERNGFHLKAMEFATNEAAKVALLAGAVDLIVTDWPWVTRQRAEGARFSFAPYSKATGALVVPAGSSVTRLADLKGKRVGVAGGPLDKSWLLLRAYNRRETGSDLATLVQLVFGAPPLLSEELAQGRIDAVLTYWHYAARLQAVGATVLLPVADVVKGLSGGSDIPMLGYAFLETWASQHPEELESFLQASREAKVLLAESDAEWLRLRPLLGTSDPKVQASLREGYRAGIINRWTEEERHSAARLYQVLVDVGGEQLVGRATKLEPGTFWPPSER
ncbi:ABC transporter substrate-binding protein [Microvirga rosea]|uniref:ABC transporter substrate-binding protein n=1 Tax=Microvirga rosea TaxID=2715425 RepID=UPI001D0A4B0B|nr:ABC transporter substrate-binding protein [Microvirga rosea]MCB8821782.1 transporter substrate-binding domain-containing protein [Microvirga rosea]